MKSKHNSKHDKITQYVSKDNIAISKEMTVHYLNLEYSSPTRTLGEIDLLIYNFDTFILQFYEIKTSHRENNKNKAIKQLNKHKDIFIPQFFNGYTKHIEAFYVHGLRDKRANRYEMEQVYSLDIEEHSSLDRMLSDGLIVAKRGHYKLL